MKYSFFILAIASIALLTSCTKKIEVVHNNYDTVYLSVLRVDTFHTIVVRTDTVLKHTADTLVEVKHDTLFLTKTTIDTLFRTYIDTVYLTRALHDTLIQVKTVIQHDTIIATKTILVPDTITKLIYLHDTINNIERVLIRDTIIKIETFVEHDTVLKYQPILGYAVPATDSVSIVVRIDSNVTLHAITFTNLISSPDGSIQSFTTLPRNVVYADGYVDMYGQKYQGAIVTAPKMLCSVSFDYYTRIGVFIKLLGITNISQSYPSLEWVIATPGQVGIPNGFSQTMVGIPLGNVTRLIINGDIYPW